METELCRLQNHKLNEVKIEVYHMCDPNHKPMGFVEQGYIAYVFKSSTKPLKIMLM
jgi:hypothetical protein